MWPMTFGLGEPHYLLPVPCLSLGPAVKVLLLTSSRQAMGPSSHYYNLSDSITLLCSLLCCGDDAHWSCKIRLGSLWNHLSAQPAAE